MIDYYPILLLPMTDKLTAYRSFHSKLRPKHWQRVGWKFTTDLQNVHNARVDKKAGCR